MDAGCGCAGAIMKYPRRTFLASLFGAAVGAFGQEQAAHIVPEQKSLHVHQMEQNNSQDPISQSLQAMVSGLKGLDPWKFLNSFEYGKRVYLNGKTVREYHLTAQDATLEIAPRIFFPAWTYNGSVPGPTLRCRVGEHVRIFFRNNSLTEHTVHFHGIHSSMMDGAFELVKPGGEYIYEFVAEPAGVQFYHCHSAPIALHMNRGLFGVFIIDPAETMAPAREMVMVMSGWDVDFDKRNEIYALNGAANFFRDNPIRIKTGELVRLFLANALEYDPINSLHLHGNYFKLHRTQWKAKPDDFTDVVLLGQAERCILEFVYKTPGMYMFHAHQNTIAESGGMGCFEVVSA
jgi:FtsP/CotA-like multicopper oxidase with cupredoxin domain